MGFSDFIIEGALTGRASGSGLSNITVSLIGLGVSGFMNSLTSGLGVSGFTISLISRLGVGN